MQTLEETIQLPNEAKQTSFLVETKNVIARSDILDVEVLDQNKDIDSTQEKKQQAIKEQGLSCAMKYSLKLDPSNPEDRGMQLAMRMNRLRRDRQKKVQEELLRFKLAQEEIQNQRNQKRAMIPLALKALSSPRKIHHSPNGNAQRAKEIDILRKSIASNQRQHVKKYVRELILQLCGGVAQKMEKKKGFFFHRSPQYVRNSITINASRTIDYGPQNYSKLQHRYQQDQCSYRTSGKLGKIKGKAGLVKYEFQQFADASQLHPKVLQNSFRARILKQDKQRKLEPILQIAHMKEMNERRQRYNYSNLNKSRAGQRMTLSASINMQIQEHIFSIVVLDPDNNKISEERLKKTIVYDIGEEIIRNGLLLLEAGTAGQEGSGIMMVTTRKDSGSAGSKGIEGSILGAEGRSRLTQLGHSSDHEDDDHSHMHSEESGQDSEQASEGSDSEQSGDNCAEEQSHQASGEQESKQSQGQEANDVESKQTQSQEKPREKGVIPSPAKPEKQEKQLVSNITARKPVLKGQISQQPFEEVSMKQPSNKQKADSQDSSRRKSRQHVETAQLTQTAPRSRPIDNGDKLDIGHLTQSVKTLNDPAKQAEVLEEAQQLPVVIKKAQSLIEESELQDASLLSREIHVNTFLAPRSNSEHSRQPMHKSGSKIHFDREK